MKRRISLNVTSFFFIMTIVMFYGCGISSVKKGKVQDQNWTCDQKADEAMKEKRYEKSIILHEFFLKENPENALAMYHMGYSHGQLGDHENEVDYYEKAIALGFYDPSLFFNLGMAYGEMGRFDDSMRIFKKALEVEPDRADNHFGLALAYQKMDSYNLAEKELKRALKLDPDDIDYLYFLGVNYVETGQVEEAKKQLEKMVKIDPENEMNLKLRTLMENKGANNTGN